MGMGISSLFSKMFGKKEMRIFMAGLDSAGKTTILYKLINSETMKTSPTLGFNVETVEYKNINFTFWDVGGHTNVRKFWSCWFQNTQGIIYVVDSSDRQRVYEAKNELKKMLEADELKDSVLLVFANKVDLPNVMSTSELADKLGLTTLRGRTWFIQNSCATHAQGLYEGLDWLSEELAKISVLNKNEFTSEEKKTNLGSIISSLFSKLFGEKPIPISMFGLGHAGKTTILYKLKSGETVMTMPTIGFNAEIVQYKNRKFDIWDVGAGGGKLYPIWYGYHRSGAGVIYVIDSSDRETIDDTKHALETLLEGIESTNPDILILANKMDLPDAMSSTELAEKLGLATLLQKHSWFIHSTSATQAQGLYEGLDWLITQLA